MPAAWTRGDKLEHVCSMEDTEDWVWNAMSAIGWLESWRKCNDMPKMTISCHSLISPPFHTWWCGISGPHGTWRHGSYTWDRPCPDCSAPARCDWLWLWYSHHICNTKGKRTWAFYHPSLVCASEPGDCGSSVSPYCWLTISPCEGKSGWSSAIWPVPYVTVCKDSDPLACLTQLGRCSW